MSFKAVAMRRQRHSEKVMRQQGGEWRGAPPGQVLPKVAGDQQEVGLTRKGCPLEPSERPRLGTPCFRPLASRTVVLSQLVCGPLSPQPWETHILSSR